MRVSKRENVVVITRMRANKAIYEKYEDKNGRVNFSDIQFFVTTVVLQIIVFNPIWLGV